MKKDQDKNILEIKNIKKYFPIRKGLLKRQVGSVKAVDDINFNIKVGETLGLVGESGCGKTTTAKLIVRSLEPTEGDIYYKKNNKTVNVSKLESKKELHEYWKKVQFIFQDPNSSLNPRMTVLQIISEPLLWLDDDKYKKKKVRRNRVRELLETVGLDSQHAERYPHAFSGGQRQRIGIARGLALNPEIVVADEPVSALDVSVQAQIINLFNRLQRKFGLTYLFIAHDLGVVKYISDRIAVMYLGKIVEITDTDQIFSFPYHPYTEALLSAVPKPDPEYELEEMLLEGEVADPSSRPEGCFFHPRCQYSREKCSRNEPEIRSINTSKSNEHFVACHYAEELELKGV